MAALLITLVSVRAVELSSPATHTGMHLAHGIKLAVGIEQFSVAESGALNMLLWSMELLEPGLALAPLVVPRPPYAELPLLRDDMTGAQISMCAHEDGAPMSVEQLAICVYVGFASAAPMGGVERETHSMDSGYADSDVSSTTAAAAVEGVLDANHTGRPPGVRPRVSPRVSSGF